MIDTILVDMDGVVADFVSAAIDVVGLPVFASQVTKWNFFEDYMTEDEFWQALREYEGFWSRRIKEYPWTWGLMQKIISTGVDIVFASSPCKDPESASGKLKWLESNPSLHGIKIEYMLGQKKWLMANPRHLLIDDNEDNCRKFQERGGNAILFPQPWNESGRRGYGLECVFAEIDNLTYATETTHDETVVDASSVATTETVLEEATRIHKDRGSNYGHPSEHFARTVGQINALFAHKLREPFQPHEWAQMMVCDKNARLVKNPNHRDSWVDIPGYANCGHLIIGKD